MDYHFRFRPEGNQIAPEYYEGFLAPRLGRTPFKVIDDPVIIAKKNQMRQALRDEYNKRLYDPYRFASCIGGSPHDPAIVRYNAMNRQAWQYYRPGPKMTFGGLCAFIILPAILYTASEEIESRLEVKLRTGQVAYKDRRNKWIS